MVSAKAKDHLDLHVANALVLCASVLMQAGFVWGPVGVSILEWNFSVRKGCNICRIVRVSHYSEMLTITTLPLLLLASGWFWSPRPRTSVKSGNSLVFPSAHIRRHVTACKVAVFLRRGHPQTQRHVISKRGSKVRRHPQTSADNEFSQLRKICDAIIQLLLRHP